MATRISNATRNAMAAAAAALVNAGGAGRIEVYTGAQPATAEDAVTGTLLATFTLNNPAYTGPTTPGVYSLVTTPALSATPVATGTAGWFRCLDHTTGKVFDGACGTSGAQLNLTTTALEVGIAVSIASGTITQPAA